MRLSLFIDHYFLSTRSISPAPLLSVYLTRDAAITFSLTTISCPHRVNKSYTCGEPLSQPKKSVPHCGELVFKQKKQNLKLVTVPYCVELVFKQDKQNLKFVTVPHCGKPLSQPKKPDCIGRHVSIHTV